MGLWGGTCPRCTQPQGRKGRDVGDRLVAEANLKAPKGPMGPALRGQPLQRLRWRPPQRRSLRLEFADELERQANLTVRSYRRHNEP